MLSKQSFFVFFMPWSNVRLDDFTPMHVLIRRDLEHCWGFFFYCDRSPPVARNRAVAGQHVSVWDVAMPFNDVLHFLLDCSYMPQMNMYIAEKGRSGTRSTQDLQCQRNLEIHRKEL